MRARVFNVFCDFIFNFTGYHRLSKPFCTHVSLISGPVAWHTFEQCVIMTGARGTLLVELVVLLK